MTTRVSHSTHQWNHQLGECRRCPAGLSTPEAELPCTGAPLEAHLRAGRKTGKGPKVPNLYVASLEGAKDLVRK